MKPSNFPQQKNARRISALKRVEAYPAAKTEAQATARAVELTALKNVIRPSRLEEKSKKRRGDTTNRVRGTGK